MWLFLIRISNVSCSSSNSRTKLTYAPKTDPLNYQDFVSASDTENQVSNTHGILSKLTLRPPITNMVDATTLKILPLGYQRRTLECSPHVTAAAEVIITAFFAIESSFNPIFSPMYTPTGNDSPTAP